MTTPFLVCATVTAVSAFVSLGFSIASVPGTNGQTRTLALYTCARSIAFAIISVVPFATGGSLWLEAVAVGMIILQALDAGVAARHRDLFAVRPVTVSVVPVTEATLVAPW